MPTWGHLVSKIRSRTQDPSLSFAKSLSACKGAYSLGIRTCPSFRVYGKALFPSKKGAGVGRDIVRPHHTSGFPGPALLLFSSKRGPNMP